MFSPNGHEAGGMPSSAVVPPRPVRKTFSRTKPHPIAWLVLVAAAVALLAGPWTTSVDAAQTAQSITATVTAARLNVRSGPGTGYPVIALVKSGDQLTLVGRSADSAWLQAAQPVGGWVSARYVRPTAPVSSLPVASAPAKPERAPVAGPTGLRGQIVFQATGNAIYLYYLTTGALRQLAFGTQPAISPDGRTVAFVRDGGEGGLWLVNADGSNLRRVFQADTVRTPAFSADGRWIAFSRVTGYDTCRQMPPKGYEGRFGCVPDQPGLEDFPLVYTPIRKLGLVDVDGGNFRDIASLDRAQAPSWGADRLVYQDASPAGLQITADHPEARSTPLLPGFQNQDPAWQPSGYRIVYQTEQNGRWQIYTIQADGTGQTALTGAQGPAGGAGYHSVSPAWSPDGQMIAFASDRSGRWALWTMNADGSNPRKLPIEVPIAYNFSLEQIVSWGR